MSIEEVVEILKMNRNAFVAEHMGSAITAYDIAINTLSAPHEMTAREFANEFHRMWDAYLNCMEDGDDCPLYTANICSLSEMENIVPIVEQWAKEHPERSEQ